MAKAETGVGGSVVAELAYRNDYISDAQGQSKFAEEAWRRNKCHERATRRPDLPRAPRGAAAPSAGVRDRVRRRDDAARGMLLRNARAPDAHARQS